MIEAVFFDVDQTLVDFDAAALRAHVELFGDSDGYLAWCDLTPSYWARFTSGELDFVAMREARMAHYLRDTGRPDDAPAMESRRWRTLEESFECYPDVADCLIELRSHGLALGVITNNDSDHQRRKLAAVGLADAFDVVAISGEMGVAKPDPMIFRRACTWARVSADRAAHVGDLLDVDAVAASAAGLHGIWLDRQESGVSVPDDVQTISTLAQLPEIVDHALAAGAPLCAGQRRGPRDVR